MILLLSRTRAELTTEAVSNWLEHFGADFVRLNAEDLQYPSRFSYRPRERVLHLPDRSVPLRDVRVVWYRRWTSFEAYQREHVDHVFDDPERQYELARFFATELQAVGEAIFAGLDHATWLGDPRSAKNDKLRVLTVAEEVGLDVPDTLVASSREALVAFAQEHGRVITKSLGGRAYSTGFGASGAASYTSVVDGETLRRAPEVMFPSLLQEAMDKAYEVRSFVLGDEVWSMAIFSQTDDQTAVDFRRYNDERPNRTVPYRLPYEVRERLRALMQRLGLTTGSADFIRTPDGRYVFLEVNPVGQFGMVSRPCNYNLEKKVAAWLVEHDRR